MRPLLWMVLLFASAAVLGADAADLAACTAIENDAERLACYDRMAGRERSTPAAPTLRPEASAGATPLAERWELEPRTDHGTFGFRAYRQNYLLLSRITDHENDQPFSPALGTPTDDQSLDRNEMKFQLSFKTKVWHDILGSRSSLWFAYTQQSHWQIFNSSISRPFRETNYEPEVIWLTPIAVPLGALRLRYAAIGLNHQSNGRSASLSRSWNRVFAEVGGEYGDFALWLRPWWRIPESADRDDNPDIEKFIGRGELVGVYKRARQTYSVAVRNNFSLGANRGSVTADWSFPLIGQLRGYVQVFSGYGESLIDYNWRQSTFGMGVLLTDRL